MEKRKIFQNSIWVLILIGVGKVLSLFRDLLISSKFGATKETDSFFLANAIPSVIFSAFLFSICALIVPFYNKIKLSKSDNVDLFVSRLINLMFLISVVLSIICLLNVRFLISILAPGFDVQQQNYSIELANILVLSFPLTALTQVLAAISNANKNNYSVQIIPVVSAVFVIITLYMMNSNDIKILAISSVVVFLLQIVIQIFIARKYFSYHFSLKFWDNNIKSMMLLSFPVFLGLSIDQINATINTMIASKSNEGVLSALNYAQRLESVINSTIITALITTSFPILSSYFEEEKKEEFKSLLLFLMKTIVIVLLPIVLFISVNSLGIIKIVFLRGNFNMQSVELTSNVFIFYSINILFASLRELLIRIMYILGHTKISFVLSGISVLITIAVSVSFYKVLGIKAFGISCLLSSVFGIVLLLFFANKFRVLSVVNLMFFLKSLILPILMMGFVVFYLNNMFSFGNSIVDISVKFILSTFVFFGAGLLFKQDDMLKLFKMGKAKLLNFM